MKKTVVIIPTYNEVNNIDRIIKFIFDKVFLQTEVSILIVDSASTDGTVEKVEQLQKLYKNLYIIKEQEKKGLASAYILGFKWALKQDYNVIVQMDADFQHPVETLPEMIAETGNYDLVIGSRYVKGGGWTEKKHHFVKSIISNIGSFYSMRVLNCPIRDLTGGYNVWSRNILLQIDLDRIHSKGYMFQIEMKYKAFKKNIRILEYPILFSRRKEGKSKMNLNIILEALFQIWKLK